MRQGCLPNRIKGLISIDWQKIRPIRGSQVSAFEELCCQLARSESDSQLIRKGAPDAGVECFVVQADESEWAWQAKYFFSLGDSQWKQIDDSVKTALSKHPSLTRFYVCLPYDRPDARVDGQRSAMEKWGDHVTKWKKWSTEVGMNVEFIYWGNSELLDVLAKPQNANKIVFWFGTLAFESAWFTQHVEEAVRRAGPRYTPEVHIDLPISSSFESFGRTEQSVKRVKSAAKQVRLRWQSLATLSRNSNPAEPELVSEVGEAIARVLTEFSVLKASANDENPYENLVQSLLKAEELVELLRLNCEQLSTAKDEKASPAAAASEQNSAKSDPRQLLSAVYSLSETLNRTSRFVNQQADLAVSKVMILRGEAGTGKTHLLCDVARKRIEAGLPTILLLGHRFTTNEEPWGQVLRMVDFPGATAAEFVAALESAAQIAGVRALLMIDAINEGKGREVWHPHLESFLEQISRSKWIGTVLSVRSSYEELVLPASVRNSSASIRHRGFDGKEYDALKSFFEWYGIEMPSAPLLDPEFANPLFLKTLCLGLQRRGERRLPRGFHGITSVFDLYLDAVQENLIQTLDLKPKSRLVRLAVKTIASRFAESRTRWMAQTDAEVLVNALLPNREFSKSLFRGLIDEGVLMADTGAGIDEDAEEVVYIAFERLADHLIVKELLDTHFDHKDPMAAFAPGGALHYLANEEDYPLPGVLEALCVQVPERCNTEFSRLVPEPEKLWGLRQAFSRSIVWRANSAFHEDTESAIDWSISCEDGPDDILDALVTVATIPDHRLNATFLDRWLRSQEMPDRDALWSTYVHRSWESGGALFRTIEWAWGRNPNEDFDDEVVSLSARVLCWMLTTSNRYARDRATKALVVLMTGRLNHLCEIVDMFADVNDVYVLERVYAVAYGVAMRSNDIGQVGKLASVVFNRVFSAGLPLPHILLRDYARGVVERALFLGANLGIDENLVRPPYQSQWPTIPSDAEIQQMSNTEVNELEQSGKRKGRDLIFDSVTGSGDFARYVIGTNSQSTDWLLVRLDEPKWKSRENELAELFDDFSEAEQLAYQHLQEQITILNERLSSEQRKTIFLVNNAEKSSSAEEHTDATEKDAEARVLIEGMGRDLKAAKTAFDAELTLDHANQLRTILNRPSETENRHGPRFDLSIIQRYVIWRVFDLGWTSERFDRFDCLAAREHGRSARKVERIGKKYQWIAFHEIKALIADHFQYSEHLGGETPFDAYEGPWQEGLRDIDPSCTLPKSVGGTTYDGHELAWWARVTYSSWKDEAHSTEWAADAKDLPDVASLLVVTDGTGKRWINLAGAFQWKQPVPEDLDSGEFDHQGIRCHCDALLVKQDDADKFENWANNIDFEMQRMPEAPTNYRIFLGEHPWGNAAQLMRRPYEGEEGWTRPTHDCPVDVRVPVFHYLKESSTFDCSVDETYRLRLPSWDLMAGLGLDASGRDAHYVNSEGEVIAFDPTVLEKGPSALLVSHDAIRLYLAQEGLVLFFIISGEKRVFQRSYGESRPRWASITGHYRLTAQEVRGSPTGRIAVKVINHSGDEVPNV